MRMTPSAVFPISLLTIARHIALLAGTALLACAPNERLVKPPLEAVASRCDLFVRARTRNALDVALALDAVSLRDATGELRPLTLSRARFAAGDAAHRLPIAGAVVPPGHYDAVIVRVGEASIDEARARRRLTLAEAVPPAAPPAPGTPPPAFVDYEIPAPFELRQHDAVSVFLEWDVDASIVDLSQFRPVWSASLEAPQVRLGLLYVADAQSGTVAALNRFTGELVGTAKVGARPEGIAIARDRQRLFVANAGDGSVSVVDLSLNFAVSTIPIRLGAGTADVAVSDDGLVVAAANPGLDTVSLFDARTYASLADLRVGRTPIRLVALPGQRRIVVINSHSNDASVIDTFSRTVVATVAVEAEPADIAVDRRGREIYVAHHISANVVVLDAATLTAIRTIHVGANMTAIRADQKSNAVFVARSAPDEIAVLDPSLSAVVRRIGISARIEALTQGLDAPLLYGAAPARGGLIVVNTVVSREESFLQDGAGPYDVLAVE